MATLNFPDEPTTGDIYNDSNSGFSYEWNGTVWISTDPQRAANIREIDDISSGFDGSDTTFTLQVAGVNVEPASAQQLIISVGGVMQNAGQDFTVSGSTLTLTTAPDSGLTFFGVLLGQSLSLNTVADGSVGSSSLKSEDFTIGGSGNTVTIPGNLTVQGTETIINTNELNVQDKTIGIGSTNAPTSATQDGAGAIIYGQTHVNILYDVDKAALGINTGVSVAGFITATGLRSLGVTTCGAGLSLADSVKAKFGNAGDLEVYHNGSDSYIEQAGTGNLIVKDNTASGGVRIFSNDFQVKNQADSEDIAKFSENGSVELYEDNVKRFETASDDQGGGVIVTGKIVGTAATIGTGVTINNTGIDLGIGGVGVVTTGNVTGASATITSAVVGTGVTINNTGIDAGNAGIVTAGTFNAPSDTTIKAGDDIILQPTDALYLKSNGDNTRLLINSVASFTFDNGAFIEKCKITAGKLSDNQNIDLVDGMVHYFSTQESTTATPNLRENASRTIGDAVSTGDIITVTLITTAAAGGYSANLTIDGNAVTEEWVGGAAPSAGSADGLDIYTYTCIRIGGGTGDSGWKVIANLTNATN